MAQAKQYNGHRSWNAWNVALWIGNDEELYRSALDCIASRPNITSAARKFLCHCGERTPDGARYNLLSVREALSGLRE